MDRRATNPVAAGLAGALLILLASSGASRADQSDEDKIKAVIDAYHAAIGSLDAKKMDPLWAHDDYVMAIQPRSKTIAVGWDAVNKSWEALPGIYSELKVTSSGDLHIHVSGSVAWTDGIAIVNGKTKAGDQIVDAATFESDVLEKRGDAWLLVSHNAWRVAK
jgi:ketosteroid isomerase-like protein